MFAFFFCQAVHLFLFFCLLSCVFLNHNISFLFALHLVFWLLLFFVFVAFIFCYFSNFGNLSKNISEKMEIGKTAKMKNAEKKTDILTRTVSTGVFTNSVFFSILCFFKFCMFAESTIKIGVSPPPLPKKNQKKNKKKKQNSKVKKWSKLKLKSGPIMLRNIMGPLFNFKIVSFFFWFVVQTSSSFCRENEIFKKKTKKNNKKIGPLFNFRKGKIWTTF